MLRYNLQELSDLIAAIYDCALEPERWREALPRLLALTQSPCGALVIHDYEQARTGRPVFLECLTYRHLGHSKTDPGAYRPEGELERWRERDPITLLEQRLEADGVARADLDAARAAARSAVEEATARALAWPEPEPDDRFESVWAAPR